ncbi:MAG: ATP-dependent zinc protease [Desulfovibrio sp.]|uniref:ATP-dependent zinc protease family protein n=1 Tax=Desulfovibrio sp. 7SRBS1 TaxID=3378064 RepID=UPI003B4207B4
MAVRTLPKMLIGWREWASLPDLNIPAVKVKIDTGARTSAIHAFDIDPFEKNGQRFVRFAIHPLQGRDDISVLCEARLLESRRVKNSGGVSHKRYVISTRMSMGGRTWPIELTLANRDQMKFRMLIGRSSMNGNLIVDPQLSYQAGRVAALPLYSVEEEK